MPGTDASSVTANKTAIKTAKPSGRSGVSLPVGAHPGNTGGKKGRSGKKPNSFKQFLASLRTDPVALAALERAAKDETLKSFSNVWKLASEYDPDKPGQKHEITGKDGGPIDIQIWKFGNRQVAF